jgi:hypothetical protein
LSKSGVNPHLPRDLVFGDITQQGLGFPDLYVHQGSYKVARFIKFISNMKHITRSLMQISYELLIIKTGCMNPFDMDYPWFQKMVSRSYLTSLWEFVFKYQIEIRCNRQGAQPPRLNDDTIMSKVINQIEGRELYLFNMCRLWIRMMWMSDIMSMDGEYISWAAEGGIRDTSRRQKWN